MTRQAVLGPIDPSINDSLNPRVEMHGQSTPVPVSVESVRGYLDLARAELNIKESAQLTSMLVNLTTHIHPLVLGSIFRTQSQIRFLARKLLSQQLEDKAAVESIINFLCADSGSHDYTINRREAIELGLKVDKPSDTVNELIRGIHLSFMDELNVTEPYSPYSILQNAEIEETVPYSIPRGFIESTTNGGYSFLSEGMLKLVQLPNNLPQVGINDARSFEGWRKYE